MRRRQPAGIILAGGEGNRLRTRATAETVYAGLAPVDFSRDVLQARPAALGVLPVSGVDWNDLGDPERVRHTRRQRDWHEVTA